MEATQYAALKSSRDNARDTASRLRRTVRYLKFAAAELIAVGQDMQAANVHDIRESLKASYGEAITNRDALEAQVAEARDEYRKENSKSAPVELSLIHI